MICSEHQKDELRVFIGISLFGPQNYDEKEFSNEFHTTYTSGSIPNLKIESKTFYQHNFKIENPTIDTFVEFLTYDSK